MKTSEILKATLLLVPAIAWAEGNNEQKKQTLCLFSQMMPDMLISVFREANSLKLPILTSWRKTE